MYLSYLQALEKWDKSEKKKYITIVCLGSPCVQRTNANRMKINRMWTIIVHIKNSGSREYSGSKRRRRSLTQNCQGRPTGEGGNHVLPANWILANWDFGNYKVSCSTTDNCVSVCVRWFYSKGSVVVSVYKVKCNQY